MSLNTCAWPQPLLIFRKKLSLGKAAQLAGYNRLDFLDLLVRRGLVPFDYDESFVESELDGIAHLASIDHDHQ